MTRKQQPFLKSNLLPWLGVFALMPHTWQPSFGQATAQLPEGSQRDVVVTLEPKQIEQQKASAPNTVLVDGYQLSTVALHPLVNHPIMACLDGLGRLFVGDAVGVNWNKAQLDANPPNRILMLEDSDGDGFFEKSTVFADKLTFPQGACWLEDSLYVCSPPGLWRFTDSDHDGVAESREKLVDGFDYTGNAADVHGPFFNPHNRRLYWCHGRKGHKVTGREGIVVHEGLASGIWSCKPDGSDVQWHSLGCGDNPVEVDFTEEGDILGVQNLYYSNPRGDTLVHYLLGGVYERADMMKAIEGLPRTLEQMPVIHNFGHVAVSGCALWHSYPGPAMRQQMLVTHFNTGRLTRVELNRSGSSYGASENEFLRIRDPDVHLTDVLEDRDGSLLLLNTGGWFRIGCPSSLIAKPDVTGAIYRICRHKTEQTSVLALTPSNPRVAPNAESPNAKNIAAMLKDPDPHAQRRACEWISVQRPQSAEISTTLLAMLAMPLDPALEHSAMYAAGVTKCVGKQQLDAAKSSTLLRRLLAIEEQFGSDPSARRRALEIALTNLDAEDSDLARISLRLVTKTRETEHRIETLLQQWLKSSVLKETQLTAVQAISARLLASPNIRVIVAQMLEHPQSAVRLAALKAISEQNLGHPEPLWCASIRKALKDQSLPLSSVVDAVKRVKSVDFDEDLLAISSSAHHALSLRLKCLSAMKAIRLSEDTLNLLINTLKDSTTTASARVQAANFLRETALSDAQASRLAQVFQRAGALELRPLTGVLAKLKDIGIVRQIAKGLAENPAIASQQESIYRTALSSHPADIFESIVLPALHRANAQHEAKMFTLTALSDRLSSGDPVRGRMTFENGNGACIGCHRVANNGRDIGPDLSKIGAIRTGRDLLESIIFPSNTLARDYETHAIETSDGTTHTGVVRGHSAEGLVLTDTAGQEFNIPHEKLVSNTILAESLMPVGLDIALGEEALIHLVAYLQTLK